MVGAGKLWVAAVYTGASLVCNATWAQDDLLTGPMQKMVLVEPTPLPEAMVQTPEGEVPLTDLLADEGVTVVNFWATWCAPCRVEMPTLAALADSGVPVLAIATGRNDPAEVASFLEETTAGALAPHADPTQGIARSFGILGLPVTLLVDADGRELGRLQGEADWGSEEAKALIAALSAP